MTVGIYLEDCYLQEFSAIVIDAVPCSVVLDRTAFYPDGGGQPSDTGTIIVGDRRLSVVKVSRTGKEIFHHIEGNAPGKGEQVKGIIDWEHRYDLMRTHTALHVLCAVVWRDYGAKVTGGDMKPLEARMDFELENMSLEFAREVESTVNNEINKERPVEINILPRDEAFKTPDLIRTKINLLPPEIQEERTVHIVGLDLQADGGTHVSNTREIGKVTIVKHESKGKTNKRLRIAISR